jgi:hypothetical protein
MWFIFDPEALLPAATTLIVVHDAANPARAP